MSSHQNSNRVVDIGEYRAARVAQKAQTLPPVPYLLWYPGLGYVQVSPSMVAAAPAGRNFPLY
jgi:hypothetical protein